MKNLASESDTKTGAVAEAAEQRKWKELEDHFVLMEADRANIIMAGVEATGALGPGMMRAVKIITEKVANRKWRVGMPAEDKWLAEKDRAEYVTDAKRKISAVVHRGRWVCVQRLVERCRSAHSPAG